MWSRLPRARLGPSGVFSVEITPQTEGTLGSGSRGCAEELVGCFEATEIGRIGSWQKPPEEAESTFRHIGEREGEICRQEETAAVGIVEIRVTNIIPRGRQFRAGVDPLIKRIANPLHSDEEED